MLTLTAALLLSAAVDSGRPVLPVPPKAPAVEKRNDRRVVEPLKGAHEPTRLPDTARRDAHGGVLI